MVFLSICTVGNNVCNFDAILLYFLKTSLNTKGNLLLPEVWHTLGESISQVYALINSSLFLLSAGPLNSSLESFRQIMHHDQPIMFTEDENRVENPKHPSNMLM